MKYVLVLVIVVVVAWLMMGRSRGRGRDSKADPAGSDTRPAAARGAEGTVKSAAADTQTMVGCTHCGLHLPRSEAVADAQGRLYCGDVHRLAGPR